MMKHLKPEKGTYALHLDLARQTRFDRVGPFGAVKLAPGRYLYLGSAQGVGGVRARVGHHARLANQPHWHLDYVRPAMTIEEVWFTHDPLKRECQWAQIVHVDLGGTIPVAGFGSADCDICPAHFFHFQEAPSCMAFRKAVRRKIRDHAPIMRIDEVLVQVEYRIN